MACPTPASAGLCISPTDSTGILSRMGNCANVHVRMQAAGGGVLVGDASEYKSHRARKWLQRTKPSISLCLGRQSAPDAIRTHDTFFRREVLYPLSYRGNANYCTTKWDLGRSLVCRPRGRPCSRALPGEVGSLFQPTIRPWFTIAQRPN